MQKMNKRLLAALLTLVMLFGMIPTVAAVTSESEAVVKNSFKYYGDQLITENSKGIYAVLEKMRDNGNLKTGTYTVDLVDEGVLENRAYDQNALMADFISARDAFMLDNAELFYVDFDKLTLSQSQSGDSYLITLGIGRDNTYFSDGFKKSNVDEAIADFEKVADEIYDIAITGAHSDTRIKLAYDEIIKRVSYALESDAQPQNVLYVRNAYGALVRGESVCEGYARALKSVLDKLGVENVLVQGTYVDGTKAEPHMWNYLKMDNNRWYLLDTTMEDGDSASSEDFFLKCAGDEVVAAYQPNGVISLSSLSNKFAYPSLSDVAYTRLSDAFTAKTADFINNISYRGLGLVATQAKGEYILASYGEEWYYYENYLEVMRQAQGYDEPWDGDCGTYFIDYYSMAYFAITKDPAPTEIVGSNYTDYYTYTGENIYDISKVADAVEYSKTAPYVSKKLPNTSVLDGGKSYDITVTYSESLKKANAYEDIIAKWVYDVEGAKIENLQWDNDKTVSFTLTTAKNYNYTTNYYVALENLVGIESGLTPNSVGFMVINTPTFSCPKVESSVNIAYANTPVLIADSNLAENEWEDSEGNKLDLPYRLSLVASTVSDEKSEDMLDKIGGADIVASQTFEISLGLCDNQISYVKGKKVKVFVPFPSGYSGEDGVTFKAYHFDSDGNAEEIDCITTEYGIIMMCDKFSPFAVIAVKDEQTAEKKLMTFASGNGSFSDEMVKFGNGETKELTVTADEGYRLEKLTLNGTEIAISNEKSMTLQLASDELSAEGNVIEASFILDKFDLGENEVIEPVEVSNITNVSYEKSLDTHNTFTVTVGGRPAMIQFIEPDGGTRTYDRNNKNVSIKCYSTDGTEVSSLDRNLAYEVWCIYTNMSADVEIRSRAKYVANGIYTWEKFTYNFTVELAERVYDGTVRSITPAATTGTIGPVETKVVTGPDAEAMRFVMPNGTATTYFAKGAAVLENGELEFIGKAWMNDYGENVIRVDVKIAGVWTYAGDFTYNAVRP